MNIHIYIYTYFSALRLMPPTLSQQKSYSKEAYEDPPRPYKGSLRIFSFSGDLPRFAATSFQGTLGDLLFWVYFPRSRIPRQTRDPQIVFLALLGWILAQRDISPESEVRPKILQSSICFF